MVQQAFVAAHHEEQADEEAEQPAVLADRVLAAQRLVERGGRAHGLFARQPHEADAGGEARAYP